MFKNFQIRYQTAAIIPAPHAHFYTLTARPAFSSFLQVDLTLTYPDRDELDEEEITGEGFTLDDDFSWSGRLPAVWLQTLDALIDTLELSPFDEEKLADNDDFFEVTVELADGQRLGTPTHRNDVMYPIQELIQAAYEAGEKELPFFISYREQTAKTELDIRIRASFAERSLKAEISQNGRSRSRTLPWSDLQPLMAVIYRNDYDPEAALLKPPKREGQYLNIGGEEWYDVQGFTEVTNLFGRLV